MLAVDDFQIIWQRQTERFARLRYGRRAYANGDAPIQQQLATAPLDPVVMSSALVTYLWQAQQHYVSPDKTLAYYPGHPSIYGARNDAIEGVTRLMPLWAAYASSPYEDAALRSAMLQQLRQSLVNGTDPMSGSYWGSIGHKSTLICEGADIALAIWLTKDDLWVDLTLTERRPILAWLRHAVGKDTADNNWHLFVVLIDLILTTLDPTHRFKSADRLRRVQSFYVSDGCFKDGPKGLIDFYNAWGFHYLLFWIHEIGGPLVADFAIDALEQYCRWYQYLFTSNGLPLFGRSLCYRFAVSGPLLSCALVSPQSMNAGIALGAYSATWQYFVRRGGLQHGRPTQGVFGDDLRWLDPYSGPASSLWGTRSLVLFYYVARRLDWRTIQSATLPAERSNVELVVPALAARIQTDARLGRTVISFDQHQHQMPDIALQVPSLKDKLRQQVFGSAVRPANNLQKAGLKTFGSDLEMYR